MVNEEDIRNRREKYFTYLFNESSEHVQSGEIESTSTAQQFQNNCFRKRIGQEEVMSALRKIGRNKFVGPNEIPIEV